jgi:dCTP deaminase
MILGDKALTHLVNKGCIEYTEPRLINPASVNIRIGETFLRPRKRPFGVYLGAEMDYKEEKIGKDGTFCLHPGEFALATTIEKLFVPPNLAAFVQGRSSIGRAGLTVQNAGFVDPGFMGHITLELKNETRNKIYIPFGYPVAQLVYFECTEVEHPYAGKYIGQIKATGSRMFMDEWQ